MTKAPKQPGIWLVVMAVLALARVLLATTADAAGDKKAPEKPISPTPPTDPSVGNTGPKDDPARTHTGKPTT